MSEGNTPQEKGAAAAASPPPQEQALVPLEARLPAPPTNGPPPGHGRKRARRLVLGILLLVVAALGAGGGWYWWQQRQAMALPAGIAWGNGRIEAEQVDIAAKTPGRLAEVLVEEGAMVRAGQVLARMDTREAEAALRRAQAQLGQARRVLEARQAAVAQQQSQLQLAEAELARTRSLVQSGYATRQALDQRSSARDVAAAALNTAMAQIGEAEQAIQAAAEEVERLQAQLADSVLTAPLDGRVQYRLANPGEVLGAGGRVLTLLDITNVYMSVFLPTQEAGRVAIGAEGRIVLDALPDYVLPAHVSFLSPQAQFTPKAVETRSERERLMFRVKLRIEPDLLRRYAEQVRTGLPGTGYVRLDPAVAWPVWLQPGRRAS
ncbi:MAG: HlyD family efflux transporter periplasmic adaptor subunit [Acetobacteraceae bacterium]|nr:HlyD family efflux transporter periplasmic adaptor subunit [Acetobacteraceae bacterium]